jgi:hypothetical protein
MLRISELKLPLPADARRADATLRPTPPLRHRMMGVALGVAISTSLAEVFKRSFDARKANLLVVYIVDGSQVCRGT